MLPTYRVLSQCLRCGHALEINKSSGFGLCQRCQEPFSRVADTVEGAEIPYSSHVEVRSTVDRLLCVLPSSSTFTDVFFRLSVKTVTAGAHTAYCKQAVIAHFVQQASSVKLSASMTTRLKCPSALSAININCGNIPGRSAVSCCATLTCRRLLSVDVFTISHHD